MFGPGLLSSLEQYNGVMNWSYKFAFDEIQEMMDNRPWLLVDDDFSSADHDEFLGMQKKLYLQRGWEWFKTVIRGRFFPQLNLTTITTWDRERNPEQGDPDLSKVQQKFPGASIVSLIGGPHIVAGPQVSPEILNQIGKIADAQHWNQKIADTWKIPAAGMAGGALAWLLSLGIPYAQIEQQLQNGASPQEIMNQVAPENTHTVPDFTEKNIDFEENIPENAEIPPKIVDNPTENARMPQVNEGNLDGLDPMFAQQIRQVLLKLTEKGWQPRVAEGLRSLEQQQTKIDQGHSSLKDPRHSKHVRGKAADIIDSRYGWGGPASDLSFQFWTDLGEAARELGLTWGGDWKTFKDVAHVEIYEETTGASVGSYRHAYQEIDLIKDKQRGKQIVRQLAKLPWQPTQGSPSVIEELMKAGIPKQLFGKLFEVYQVFRSQVAADSWNHIYANCEAR